LKPKPSKKNIFVRTFLFWILVFINSSYLFSQVKTDSLTIYTLVEDSLNSHTSKIDSLELSIKQLSSKQEVRSGFNEKIDSTINHEVEKLDVSNKIADTIISHINLNRISPKIPDLGSKIKSIDLNKSNSFQSFDVPKIQLLNLGDNSLKTLQEQPISSKLKTKHKLDSLSFKEIEKEGEELAKNNIKELQELDKMEGSANTARSQVENLKWDKSKIKSSKNVAKVLSKNVDAIQTGMDKMKDFKGKYSKVNLMNPNGPVLKEISKKPVKPWQFSLNFSSQIQNGLTIQMSPAIGYKVYEKLIGGIGLSYQNKIIYSGQSIAFSEDQEFSHRVFSQYNFYRNFFLHVEHELPYKQRVEYKESSWYNLDAQKSKGWLGMALQYKVYKNIKGQTQILYNIIKPDTFAENRWTIRVNLNFN